MNRREFIKLTGLGTIGIAAAVKSGDFLKHELSPQAASATEGHHHHHNVLASFTYNNQQVEVLEHDGMIKLRVNGHYLDHHAIARTSEGYGSHLLPFCEFEDPITIAKSLLDGNERLFRL